MAKALPKSIKDHELEKEWVSYQEYGKKILILENGEKLMEDGLETKAPVS